MATTGLFRYNPIRAIFSSSDSSKAIDNRHLESVVATYQNGDFNATVKLLRDRSTTDENLQGIFLALATCYARMGNFNEALTLADRELALSAPHPHTSQLRNDILAWLKRSEARSPITIFTVPKPFKGHNGMIQRNAILSWLKLEPRPEIILMGDEEGMMEVAREFGLIYEPSTDRNDHGTPLINSIFERAQELATNGIIAYVNTDIIFTRNFPAAIEAVSNLSSFLVVGRRWDIDIWQPIDFDDAEWDVHLADNARKTELLHGTTGIDYFIFRKGLYRGLPPFAVGRTVWDNWLIWEAKRQGTQLIDATHAIHAFHQEHSYTHAKGGVNEVWRGAESNRNRKLAAGHAMTVAHADFCIEGNRIVPIHDGYRCPEPTQQDYIDMKFRQSLTAYLNDDPDHALDLLSYIELDASNCTLPVNYQLHKAKILLALGRKDDALAMIHGAKPSPSSECYQQLLEGKSRMEDEIVSHKFTNMLMKEDVCSDGNSWQSHKQSIDRSNDATQDPPPIKRNHCLFLNTYYSSFLDSHYEKHSKLSSSPYIVQKQSLQYECFGDSNFYSEGLINAVWDAEDLVVNCVPLQQAWAHENNFHGEGLCVVVEQIRRACPDVVYIQDLNICTKEFLELIRPHTNLIVGQIASPIPPAAHLHGFDILVSSFPHFVERFRQAGITSYYQPLAFETKVWDLMTKYDFEARPIECSFVGGLSALHNKGYGLMEYLANETSIHFWGYGVDTLPTDSIIRTRHHGEVWGKDMFRILASSKITVNRHIDVAENYANNMRLFEATGCGALLITDYKDNLGDLFEIGKEVVAYRSQEECVALIKYYLKHPEEASVIAKAGQARTLREHTYEKRMMQTAEFLTRHLRYQEEINKLPALDINKVNYGHTPIVATDVTTAMTMAWQNQDIPARQRSLVQQELYQMYHGNVVVPFKVLTDILRPYIDNETSILEVGCASGYYYEILVYLLNKRIKYTGVDYSEAMIGMAKDYYPNATFFAADGANLFFKDRLFHTVISSCVLLHVPNWRQHIFETVRVADRYVVASRTPVCKQNPTRYMKKYAYGVETVELIFNEEEIVREFLLNGLELIDLIQYNTNLDADTYSVTYLFKRP